MRLALLVLAAVICSGGVTTSAQTDSAQALGPDAPITIQSVERIGAALARTPTEGVMGGADTQPTQRVEPWWVEQGRACRRPILPWQLWPPLQPQTTGPRFLP